MEVRHLELLRELRDRGTLAAVARATHRTPSAVSQQLKAAERAAHTRLVEPAGRGLRLTEAGHLLADRAVEVATLLARTDAQLSDLHTEPVGTVRIAGLPSALEALLPTVLTRLAEEDSGRNLRVELAEEDVAEHAFAALSADHDIVVAHTLDPSLAASGEATANATGNATQDRARGRGRPAKPAGLVRHTLARESLDVALPAGHRLARRAALRAVHLVGEPWIGVPEGYPFDRVRRGVEAATGYTIEPVIRLRDNHLVAALVSAGHGIAVLPRFTTPPRSGLVTLPLLDVPSRRFVVALVRPDRAERAAVRVVLALLADAGRRAEARHAEAGGPRRG
jgi:DNA-binding transcriptional LysR family regulator